MPLIFSPVAEKILDSPPKRLLPRHAFIMRQLGQPPKVDLKISQMVTEVLASRGFESVDAGASTGGIDFLERILALIRGTGFTVAVFSHETRATAMANIMLELGFALMCGKPLILAKSKEAVAPSDMTRTDWVEYQSGRDKAFRLQVGRAADAIQSLVDYEDTLLNAALEARAMDCAIAFERANKGFLLSGERRFIDAAGLILDRLSAQAESGNIHDIERLRGDLRNFIRQARRTSSE